MDGVEDELNRLSELPGQNGRLARVYLEKLRDTRHYESNLRQLRRDDAKSRRPGARMPQDLERVETMIGVIQEAHLDGNLATREGLLEAALQGMLSSLHRHSSFFNSEEYKKFE